MTISSVAASKSGLFADPRPDWLALRQEEILDPRRPIVDAHHHLWERPSGRYLLDELRADLGSGHNVRATVFIQ